MRAHAAEIFSTGIQAVSPMESVMNSCRLVGNVLTVGNRSYDLSRFRRILVIGAGKAGAPMAQALETMLGPRIDTGLISVKYDHGQTLSRVRVIEAGHPIPDEKGMAAAGEMLNVARSATGRDLLICLLSGGGSALMPLPVPEVTLTDKQNALHTLLSCGAPIQDVNILRKHISAIKGGWLAATAQPATVLTLALSDVIGDDPAVIASGPTVPDSSTFADCLDIVEKYGIRDDLPEAVMAHIRKGARGAAMETPKAGDAAFHQSHVNIVASNIDALAAAKQKALQLGYNTLILSSRIDGDTSAAARFYAAIAQELKATRNPLPPPACILSGGETTVRVEGNGMGGRNMEFALAFAVFGRALKEAVLLSAGTDGTDGPTDAAGAVVDGHTWGRAAAAGLSASDYLARNDSYRFFAQLDDLFITGPTRTNVMDMKILLVS